jgi:hypothetical protein
MLSPSQRDATVVEVDSAETHLSLNAPHSKPLSIAFDLIAMRNQFIVRRGALISHYCILLRAAHQPGYRCIHGATATQENPI